MRTGTSQTTLSGREPKQRRNASPKDQNHRRRKLWLDIPSTLLKRIITKNRWKEIFKKNTTRHKRNQKYYKNGHRKNSQPKIHFGTTVSDRKKEQKRTGNEYNR